jgi:hypothetical protein
MAVDLVRCRQPSTIKEAGMATKITVALDDDLEGGPADETMRFAVGGTAYEIDLNTKNARAFRKQLAPFIEHARRAGRGRSASFFSHASRCPATPIGTSTSGGPRAVVAGSSA